MAPPALPSPQGGPIKVAVIGGGCASIAAAFELTRPEHAGAYEVTVYQLGWRLGGKGASGRGVADRIEEHGLHLWMGFYENAFRLMRECYAELGRDPEKCRIADWTDAFSPAYFNAVADWSPIDGWTRWKVLFPPCEGMPGDPVADQEPWTVARYLGRCVLLLRTLLESVQAPGAIKDGRTGSDAKPTTPNEVVLQMGRLLRYSGLATLGALLEAVNVLEMALRVISFVPEELILRFHTMVVEAVRSRLDELTRRDDELRRLWEIVDLVLAVIRGCIRSRLLTDPRGFDAINDYDCREWLRLNGASDGAINSAFVRALYDLAFAYEDGDFARPRIAAGQALRGAVRAFFTYRGAFFWKMHSGMGDAVFAPFYQVLRKRGVRFAFFHRLENVKVGAVESGERPFVEALEFDVQAETVNGREYEPLVDIRGLPCWPAAPDLAQLVDGEKFAREGRAFESHWDRRRVGAKVLQVTQDFDFVVLGTSLGTIPHLARELIEKDARWKAMARHCKTVPTQAFQIWMSADMREMGWVHGPVVLSGFVEPFDTWADMSHLAKEESWPAPPKAIAYFCSALPDKSSDEQKSPLYPASRCEEVRQSAIRFLNQDVGHLWPLARRSSEGFRWDLLSIPPSEKSQTPFDTQYWTANVNPSDRYALSLPGTLRYRLSPLEITFDNLTIAGDWTNCGFNEGCVEAAVMSGRLAAHAISSSPPLDDIVGFDHP